MPFGLSSFAHLYNDPMVYPRSLSKEYLTQSSHTLSQQPSSYFLLSSFENSINSGNKVGEILNNAHPTIIQLFHKLALFLLSNFTNFFAN
jgi:hypothetical protein